MAIPGEELTMPTIARRLEQLERCMRQIAMVPCRQCRGFPPAIGIGPGVVKAASERSPLLSEDGRCTACGTEAMRITFVVPGVTGGEES